MPDDKTRDFVRSLLEMAESLSDCAEAFKGLTVDPRCPHRLFNREEAIKGPRTMMLMARNAGKVTHHKQMQQIYRGGTQGRKR